MESIIIKEIRYEIEINDFYGSYVHKYVCAMWETMATKRIHCVNVTYGTTSEEARKKMDGMIDSLNYE